MGVWRWCAGVVRVGVGLWWCGGWGVLVGWPLGSSGQVVFYDVPGSSVEWLWEVRVGRPVGFGELWGLGWTGDVPAVLVDEPVVEPTDQNQVFQVGGSALGPGLAMVTFKPPGVGAAGEPTRLKNRAKPAPSESQH